MTDMDVTSKTKSDARKRMGTVGEECNCGRGKEDFNIGK